MNRNFLIFLTVFSVFSQLKGEVVSLKTFHNENTKQYVVMIGVRHSRAKNEREQEAFFNKFFNVLNKEYQNRAKVFTERLTDKLRGALETDIEGAASKSIMQHFKNLCYYDVPSLTNLYFKNKKRKFKVVRFDNRLDRDLFSQKALIEHYEKRIETLLDDTLNPHKEFIEKIILEYEPEFSDELTFIAGRSIELNFLNEILEDNFSWSPQVFVLYAGISHIKFLTTVLPNIGWTLIDSHDSSNPKDWTTEDNTLAQKGLLPKKSLFDLEDDEPSPATAFSASNTCSNHESFEDDYDIFKICKYCQKKFDACTCFNSQEDCQASMIRFLEDNFGVSQLLK